MDREDLYARTPIWVQNLLVGIESRRINKARFGPRFRELLAQYEGRSLASVEEATSFRNRRLIAFVAKAVDDVPYYRDLFSSLNLSPKDMNRLEDLSAIPILEKQTVRDNPDLFTPKTPSGPTLTCHTSGSTGAGLRFPSTWEAHWEQWAVWWRFRRWHGLNMDTPCAYLAGRSVVPVTQKKPPYWRNDDPNHRVFFSGYHLGPDTAKDYLDHLEHIGAPWLHGYPSLVSVLAGFALDLGRTLPFKWVTLGAENVMPAQVQVIKKAFGVDPLHHYGMAEGVGNLSLCPEHKLHVDEDFAAIEFAARPDGAHDLVGTGFANEAFPLIRYRVGDVVTLGDETCGCGRPGRVVAAIDGRQEDFVVTRSGNLLGRLDHIFKDEDQILESQIVQQEKGTMTVRVVKAKGYTQTHEDKLRQEILKRVGAEVSFDIQYVDSLPRTESGKVRFVISTVAPLSRSLPLQQGLHE